MGAGEAVRVGERPPTGRVLTKVSGIMGIGNF